MNYECYSGGSQESDDNVSVRSDPPMINEYLPTPTASLTKNASGGSGVLQNHQATAHS